MHWCSDLANNSDLEGWGQHWQALEAQFREMRQFCNNIKNQIHCLHLDPLFILPFEGYQDLLKVGLAKNADLNGWDQAVAVIDLHEFT